MNDNGVTFDLSDPSQARAYIAQFKMGDKIPSYITTNQNRLIHFRNMSDDDAIFVAHELWDMELKSREVK